MTSQQLCVILQSVDISTITREVESAKRYKSPLLLTDKGYEIGRKIADKIDGVLDTVSVGLTEEERIAFYRSLSIVSESLEAVAKNR